MRKKSDVDKIEKIAKELRGLQTLTLLARKLGVSRRTAINYVSKLRKRGYLENVYGGRVKLYRISPLIKKKEGYSLYESLNKNTKVKINVREDYIIHSEKAHEVEWILVRAVQIGATAGNFRLILASLGMFNKINNWSKLKKYAREYVVERKIGALYDTAKRFMRVRRMDERTRNGLLKGNGRGYIIKNVKSKDFKDIEKEWRVFIPFNKADLEAYKE